MARAGLHPGYQISFVHVCIKCEVVRARELAAALLVFYITLRHLLTYLFIYLLKYQCPVHNPPYHTSYLYQASL